MYTPAERERLRAALLAAARADPRITGGALTGSAAAGSEDQWSDIDLAFGIGDGALFQEVLADWTDRMYRDHGVLHHVDVPVGASIYRVFLLPSTLQVDLAFSPAAEFGARAPTFRLLFGSAAELARPPAPTASNLIGLGWLHALHARSCLERGKLWQAEYMVSGVRDQALALACLRLGLPTSQGRGLDLLPAEVTAAAAEALVRAIAADELRRAFRVAIDCLLSEISEVDANLAARLERAVRELT